jgi:3-mercaptopyruvate sulfurtransferase SseA
MRGFGRKLHPVNVAFEARARNLLKSELKRRGLSYSELAKALSRAGVYENDRNISNKISRGGFSAAFFLQCLDAIGCASLRIRND